MTDIRLVSGIDSKVMQALNEQQELSNTKAYCNAYWKYIEIIKAGPAVDLELSKLLTGKQPC